MTCDPPPKSFGGGFFVQESWDNCRIQEITVFLWRNMPIILAALRLRAEEDGQMKTHTGYSERQEIEPALQEACGSLAASRPAMVLFFSDQARFAAFSEQLQQRFPDSAVIGASTHASFGIHGFCRHGLLILLNHGRRPFRSPMAVLVY